MNIRGERVNADKERLRLNRRSQDEETISGLSKTQEGRIVTGVLLVKKLVIGVVMLTGSALAFYHGVVARQASAEATIQQHAGAIAKLDQEKQSKEAAAARDLLLITKLEEMEKRIVQRLDAIERRRESRER